MSEFGPALFVSRLDGAALSDAEQATVLRLVQTACRDIGLTGDDGDAAEPTVYDYDGYEKDALGVLLHSSFAYKIMPAEIQADTEVRWKSDGARVAERVERAAPGVYRYLCYGVED